VTVPQCESHSILERLVVNRLYDPGICAALVIPKIAGLAMEIQKYFLDTVVCVARISKNPSSNSVSNRGIPLKKTAQGFSVATWNAPQ
jgi:hypothetical protein